MSYTEAEIKKYFEIIKKYTKPKEDKSSETDRKTKCWNCQKSEFDLVSGFKICENCGSQNGHVLGFFDKRDYDRLIFRKKSIYQRKYHYEKKIKQVSKRLNLNEDEKYNLYLKLLEIDNSVLEKLNKQFSRKRTINIVFLIKKILEEMNNPKHKLVELSIGHQTLENYEKWWNSYKTLNLHLCEKTSKLSQSNTQELQT